MFHTIFRSSISNARPFTRALVLAFSATFISTPSQDAAASSAPYPQSGTITSVSWDFAHVTQTAFGSDIWPVTWASDDNLYTGWGDGIGFGAFDFNEQWSSPERASIGFSRISGGPTNFTAVNVWSGENRLNAPTFCGKTGSMISVDGVLYCSVASHFNNTSNNELQCASDPSIPELRLAWSSDLSESWAQSTWKVVQNPGTFSFANFLNFGKDNAGAFDSNVYLYGSKAGDVHNTYLDFCGSVGRDPLPTFGRVVRDTTI